MFVNYHRHSSYSNIIIPDSPVTNRDYALRAVELGHKVLSGVEHGWAGRYIEGYTLAKEYGLRFLFGVEAYIVKNRFEKDSTNAHIVLLAKNERGRRGINRILSEANQTGFYHRARIDLELLLTLNPNDVWLTSGCIAGLWKYADYEAIFSTIVNHFGYSFMFEVQPHLVDSQKELNRRIVDLANRMSVRIIAGCDSHYIYPEQFVLRDELLESKRIHYEEEDGWFMDFPDEEELRRRFIEQGVLSSGKIDEAIGCTNIFYEVEEYDCACFDTATIKMPTIFPDLSVDEKNLLLRNIVMKRWEGERVNIDQSQWPHYLEEIGKELDIVEKTGHADYFLLNHRVATLGKEMGGILTLTGRGSGVSFYISFLLGFTKLDRIASPVKMFPERFMSAERMLEAKSLADFDFNTAEPEPFYKAQKALLGEEKTFPMIAYGTMKTLAAWKAFARSKGIDAQVANEVSGNIHDYEMALFRAKEEDEDAELDPLDYIPEEFHGMVVESHKFLNIVMDGKIHPCAYLVYPGNIPEEIGLIRLKQNICCIMDGLWAETAKCLKNDLLKVQVVELIHKVFQEIGEEPFDVNELMRRCDKVEDVWKVYHYAWTVGINQVERHGTAARVAKFAPRNLAELAAFVAAIRPGFKSYYSRFEAREPFEFGVASLDKLIQTPDFPFSYMLYQENAMAVLAFAGIPVAETYEIVKNIAKKRAEKVFKYKERFLIGMAKRLKEDGHADAHQMARNAWEFVNVVSENGVSASHDISDKIAHDTWRVIEDSSRYSFNASHSVSVAADSLYGAYLKSKYPLAFYTTFMKIMEKSGDKDRLTAARNEAEEAYGIQFPPMRLGQDNRTIVMVPKENAIVSSMSSLKGFGDKIAQDMWELGQKKYAAFLDFLVEAAETKRLSKKIETLIQIGYFNQFGGNKKLLDFYHEFTEGSNRYSITLKPVTKEKRLAALRELWDSMPNAHLPIVQQIQIENDVTGSVKVTYPELNKRIVYVMKVDDYGGKYAPRIMAYSLRSGKSASLKIYKKQFERNIVCVGDVLYCQTVEKKHMVDGKFVDDESAPASWWLTAYEVIHDFDERMAKI